MIYKKSKYLLLSIFLLLMFVPLMAYAASVTSLISVVSNWVKSVIPLIVALSLLYFLYGVSKFILKSGDPTAREEGKQKMVWGVVALFVTLSVWGLVVFIQNSLDIDNEVISIPTVPFPIP